MAKSAFSKKKVKV